MEMSVAVWIENRPERMRSGVKRREAVLNGVTRYEAVSNHVKQVKRCEMVKNVVKPRKTVWSGVKRCATV